MIINTTRRGWLGGFSRSRGMASAPCSSWGLVLRVGVWAGLLGLTVFIAACSKSSDASTKDGASEANPSGKPVEEPKAIVDVRTLTSLYVIRSIQEQGAPRIAPKPEKEPSETQLAFEKRFRPWQDETRNAVNRFDSQYRYFCLGRERRDDDCSRTELTKQVGYWIYKLTGPWECLVIDVIPNNGWGVVIQCATHASGELAYTVHGFLKKGDDLRKGELIAFMNIDGGHLSKDTPLGMTFIQTSSMYGLYKKPFKYERRVAQEGAPQKAAPTRPKP